MFDVAHGFQVRIQSLEDKDTSADLEAMRQLRNDFESRTWEAFWKTAIEGKSAIDSSGELPGGRVFEGAAELSDMLKKTESEAFARTAVQRMLTFALGRELTPTDRCTVDDVVSKTSKQNHRWIDLIMEIVNSRPFQYYDWDDPSTL